MQTRHHAHGLTPGEALRQERAERREGWVALALGWALATVLGYALWLGVGWAWARVGVAP